jgi:hypothetical protein
MVKAQIGMIMTEPFQSLNLMALVPQAPPSSAAGAGLDRPPTTLRGLARLVRHERRRMRLHQSEPPPVPDRGEMLLVKQLLYFERYGKLYMGDRPLIWDTEVYRALLALPQQGVEVGP